MPETLPTALLFAAFVVFFPLFWMFVVWLISRLGGWHSLAETFSSDRPPTGETFTWTSGKFNFFSNYSNCLNVTVSGNGVHIVPVVFFRIGHKPLFLPWDSVSRLVQRRFLFNYVNGLHVETPDGTHPVTLYGHRLSEALAKYAPPRLKNQTLPSR